MTDYKILMRIVDKRFGKNWIDYEIKNIQTDTVIHEGRCNEVSETRAIYKGLLDVYGLDQVLLLQR